MARGPLVPLFFGALVLIAGASQLVSYLEHRALDQELRANRGDTPGAEAGPPGPGFPGRSPAGVGGSGSPSNLGVGVSAGAPADGSADPVPLLVALHARRGVTPTRATGDPLAEASQLTRAPPAGSTSGPADPVIAYLVSHATPPPPSLHADRTHDAVEQRAQQISSRMLATYRASKVDSDRAVLNQTDIDLSHLRGYYLYSDASAEAVTGLLDALDALIRNGAPDPQDEARWAARIAELGTADHPERRYYGMSAADIPGTPAFRANHPDAEAVTEPVVPEVTEAQAHFSARDWTALEALTDRLSGSDARVPGGEPVRNKVYRALGQQYHDRLLAWQKSRPGSSAARIALARRALNVAWQARGTAYASGTDDQQFAAYFAGLREAADWLSAPGVLRDPYAYELLLQLTEVSEHPRQQLDATYAAATRAFPANDAYASIYSGYLEEKWFGAPGELAAYFRTLADRPGGELGELYYAEAILGFARCCASTDYLDDAHADWSILRNALRKREARYGLSAYEWSWVLRMAGKYGDRDTAQWALPHILTRDPHIWSEEVYLVEFICWATACAGT